MHAGDIGRGRGAPRADGPDGLIGEREGLALERLRQGLPDLGSHHGLGLAAVALGQGLADADDGMQARPQGRLDLGRDAGAGLAQPVAALGVAQDHPTRPGVVQQFGRDAPGEGPGRLGPAVLGPDLHRRSGRGARDPLDQRRRGKHHHLGAPAVLRRVGLQGLDLRQAGGRAVHLPVPGDQLHGLFHGASLGTVAGQAKPSLAAPGAPPL